ncbi:F-box associated ubiquitination effector family protein [Raphanus sativus]|uniref:F-box protein At5g49610-like n=1 Tax=Raphanus sativus TaxID=3726 RepID=A0A9W3CDX2_RAPSA|nr:F-box protein At5g49610-like [Raphanus sativus]KAJ4877172.1 F-box associated ubiquitination effector family protein [Raphanus sativus]
MSSPVIDQDMIIEILSRFPASDVGKSSVLNKECNKRSYESWFLNLNRDRTNSISGYFAQYSGRGSNCQTRFVYDEKTVSENNGVSIDFLPPGKIKIEACDASHGILLCVNETRSSVTEYIVCKPTTKQYQIIPNPTMQTCAVSFGLAVNQLNPFGYKILRLSRLPGVINRSHRTFVCEVFDSDSFRWKRIKNLRLPRNDGLILSKPVHATRFLHWLSWDGNVIRFCLETETWSFFKTPNFGVAPTLVRYEGKLGVSRWWMTGSGEGLNRLWVLKSSFEKAWVKVKDIKRIGRGEHVLWTPSNDMVTLSSRDRLCVYNVKSEKLSMIHMKKEGTDYVWFPFRSDYERVNMDESREAENRN